MARPFHEDWGREGRSSGDRDKKGNGDRAGLRSVGSFSGGLAAVQKGGAPGDKETWTYIKPDGSRPFEKKYAWAWAFSEGLARVQVDDRIAGKFGYIDVKGVMVIQPNFDEASDFRNGRATVRLGGKSQTIDKKGSPLE